MPTTVNDLLRTYPADLGGVDREAMARCIEECLRCAQACTACADACLSEPTVADLTKCIRTDMDCADVCTATAAVLSRHTGYDANVTRIGPPRRSTASGRSTPANPGADALNRCSAWRSPPGKRSA